MALAGCVLGGEKSSSFAMDRVAEQVSPAGKYYSSHSSYCLSQLTLPCGMTFGDQVSKTA